MKVLEQFVLSKTGKNEYCEDKIFINDDFACIVDGASSKFKYPKNEQPGLIAANSLCDEISHLPEEINACEAIQKLSQRIKKELVNIEKSNGGHHYHKSMAASVIIYSQYHREVWSVGDCQCLVGEELYRNSSELDKIMSATRSLFLELEISSGKTVTDLLNKDTGREFIRPLLEKQIYLQNGKANNAYSYSAIDGQNIPENSIKIIKIPHHINSIVLTSDGYPEVKPTLAETEKDLQQILQQDPLCYKIFKSTKGLQKDYSSFDDRAYLKILL